MANEAEQAIYQRLASAPLFHPASVELLPEDWGIETGDIVSVKSGDETYNVPVYSHTLVWNGKSKATIESTGHEQREPLPELRRKEYQQGHAMYSGFKAQQEEINEHYQHVVEVTDQGLSDAFGIIGVSIGEDGMPAKDASGNYIWDDSGTGGEIWGHLTRSAWTQVIQNHIQDANGNILSIGQVLTSADGQALIQAINDQRTGTAQINADRIHIQSTSGSGIVLDNNGDISINAAETVTRINGQTGSGIVYLNANTIKLNGEVIVGAVSSWGDGLTAARAGIGRLAILGESGASSSLDITGDVILRDGLKGQSDSYIYTPSISVDELYIGGGTGFRDGTDLTTCVVASIGPATASGGQITIPWTKLDGTAGTPVNFNIAATQYYLDHVAAAYTNAVNRVSWPTTPRTQSSFSVSVPGNPWNASTETGTTLNRIFALSAGGFDSNHISTVELAMSHNENGQAVADGVVAKIDVDASGVYSAGDSAGYSRGYSKGMDDVGVYITKNGSWVSSWTVQSGNSETFYPAKWINGDFLVDYDHALTVTATGGSSSITNQNINIANQGEIAGYNSDPGDGYTTLGALGRAIQQLLGITATGKYMTFRGVIDGISDTTPKYYKIPL